MVDCEAVLDEAAVEVLVDAVTDDDDDEAEDDGPSAAPSVELDVTDSALVESEPTSAIELVVLDGAASDVAEPNVEEDESSASTAASSPESPHAANSIPRARAAAPKRRLVTFQTPNSPHRNPQTNLTNGSPSPALVRVIHAAIAGHRRSIARLQRRSFTMVAMDWFANNWPIVLVALAVFIIATGLIRKVAKLAFIGIAIGALGLVIWPLVSESF